MRLIDDLAGSIRRPDHWVYAAWLDTVSRYRRHRLGLLWLFVPTALYIWGVGGFLGSMQPGLTLSNFFAHIAVGYAVFRLATTVFTDSATVFASRRSYIYDGSLRLTDFLLRSIAKTSFYFLLTLPLVLVVLLGSPQFQWTGIPLALAGLLLVAANLVSYGVVIGLLGARLPDLDEFMGNATLALFLLTPIVWMPEMAPAGTIRGTLMRANPFHHMVEVVRAPLMGHAIDIGTWWYLAVFTVVGAVLAVLGYQRFARDVPVWL